MLLLLAVQGFESIWGQGCIVICGVIIMLLFAALSLPHAESHCQQARASPVHRNTSSNSGSNSSTGHSPSRANHWTAATAAVKLALLFSE
jgi:hypothetical protein